MRDCTIWFVGRSSAAKARLDLTSPSALHWHTVPTMERIPAPTRRAQSGGRDMTETTQPRRLKRLWMPAAILVLGIGGMTALVLADALEPMLQFWIMTGIIFGTPLL